MSFKNLRDLSESLIILEYPRIRSIQILYNNNGSLKSFKIVADILQWLTGRLEPGTTLLGGVDSESNRILLIKSAAEFFFSKLSVKLNPRKLYISSSATAKELIKITNALIIKSTEEYDDHRNEDFDTLIQMDVSDQMNSLKETRDLSSELTKRGAVLYDLLSNDVFNRENFINQTSQTMESSFIERTLKSAINSLQLKMNSAKNQLETLGVENSTFKNKLQRKKAELDRSKQRLEALQKIRPVYLEEFEQLEIELSDLFQHYFLRVQSRDALRAQMNARIKGFTPIPTPVTKSTENFTTNFIPEDFIDSNNDNCIEDYDDENDDNNDYLKKSMSEIINQDMDVVKGNNFNEKLEKTRIRPTTGRVKPKTGAKTGRHKIVGSMLGDPDDDSLDDTMENGDSDSEIDFNATGYKLNSDDDISLSKLTGNVRGKTEQKYENYSDEDF